MKLKNLKWLLVLVAVLSLNAALTSCSDDDGPGDTKIVGVWYEGSPTRIGTINEIMEDGTFRIYYSETNYLQKDGYAEGSWKLSGNTFTVTVKTYVDHGERYPISETIKGTLTDFSEDSFTIKYSGGSQDPDDIVDNPVVTFYRYK